MREAKVFTEDGMTFLFVEGTVGFQVPNDELSRRLSLGMAITQRRGYLLTWFFAAPHKQELLALTNQRASFDPEPVAKVSNSPVPGGGVADAAASQANNSSNAAATTAGQGQEPTDQPQQASSRPSLLRPGETMESPQGNGAPVKKK